MSVAIRFRTQSNSPYGTYSPGQVAVVSEEFAEPLLEGGYAELVDVDIPIEDEGHSEAQELADSARDAGFTGEAGFQDESVTTGDDDGDLAAALGVSEPAAPEIPVVANFGAAKTPAEAETPGEGVASLTGGDLVKPTGRRKTGGGN